MEVFASLRLASIKYRGWQNLLQRRPEEQSCRHTAFTVIILNQHRTDLFAPSLLRYSMTKVGIDLRRYIIWQNELSYPASDDHKSLLVWGNRMSDMILQIVSEWGSRTPGTNQARQIEKGGWVLYDKWHVEIGEPKLWESERITEHGAKSKQFKNRC